MNSTITTAQQIRQRIQALPIGAPCTAAAFLACEIRASVDQALSRMVKTGAITRGSRGLLVRPEMNRLSAR